jgi:MFS family permease
MAPAPADVPAALPSPRNFALFWGAVSISQLGDAVYALAIPLIVYNITGSAAAMSLLYGLGVVPQLVFGIVGGAFADRTGQRGPIIVLTFAAGLLLTVFSATLALNLASLWLICVMAVLLGSLAAALNPCYESAIPALVGESGLLRANSRLETSRTVTVILGPAVAGAAVVLASGAAVALMNAASFVLAGALMSGVAFTPVPRRDVAPARGELVREMREGLAYVRHSARLRFGVLLSTACNVALTGSFETLLIFRMRAELALPSAEVGLCFAGGTGAALLTSLLIPRTRQWLSLRTGICVSITAIGIAAIIASRSTGLVTTLLAQCLFISAALTFNVYWRAYRQSVCPPELLGRVAGATRGIAYAGAAIGAWIAAAVLAAQVGVQSYLLVAGVAVVALGLGGVVVFARMELVVATDD